MLKIMAGGLSERERERERETDRQNKAVGVDFQGNLVARPLEEEVAISSSSERSDKED
jgi:hypothetical protein